MIAFALLFLLSRLIFLPEEKRFGTTLWAVKSLADFFAIFLVFGFSNGALLFAVMGLIANSWVYLTELFDDGVNYRARAYSLIGVIVLCTLLPIDFLHPNAGLFRGIVWNTVPSAAAVSILLALKESNFVVKWVFSRTPSIESLARHPKTKNGRIIGILERLILILFFWLGAPLAATLIVAIKGLAQFERRGENQAFAEYVIIGTFLSVLLALLAFQLPLYWIGLSARSVLGL